MSGREFWTWFPVWFGLGVVGWRWFAAAWHDHDDDRTAIGAHVWRFRDEPGGE
jgi:hypothetical protein